MKLQLKLQGIFGGIDYSGYRGTLWEYLTGSAEDSNSMGSLLDSTVNSSRDCQRRKSHRVNQFSWTEERQQLHKLSLKKGEVFVIVWDTRPKTMIGAPERSEIESVSTPSFWGGHSSEKGVGVKVSDRLFADLLFNIITKHTGRKTFFRGKHVFHRKLVLILPPAPNVWPVAWQKRNITPQSNTADYENHKLTSKIKLQKSTPDFESSKVLNENSL